jgi:exopolyphosphatase/guanosine-5'-triphosphate,3'-diphosphate pyrophosphatase
MQKIAAIDAGSNALRLVVANLDDAWQVQPVENIRIPVRLGEDVFTNNTLREPTIQQAVEAFNQFHRIVNDFGVSRLRAVATSAVREAQNSEILVDRILRASGIELEVINGEEEARLVHLAVAAVLDLGGKRAMLVDIGGGSVEITITKDGNILSSRSYNLGTVRLLQRLQEEGLSRQPEMFDRLLREYTDAARRRIEQEIGNEKVDICVGTGGNVEELGELRQKIFEQDSDRCVTMKELDELVRLLDQMSVKERIHKFNLRPDRADVILPASIVLKMIAGIAGVEEILIPDVGLKNGILLDLAHSMAQEMHLPDRDQVWGSAIRIGQKYQFNLEHAACVSRLATRLFDQALTLHLLAGEERLILEIGALLHDVGHFINTVDHDQHGYYLLRANHIIGLSERQQEMVACLVQFHRKGTPYREQAASSTLSQKDRLTVTKLCAFLRLADALDGSRTQRVTDVNLSRGESGWRLRLSGAEDLTLEKWSVMKRRSLFQEIFGSSLEIDDQ